jgi:hypothetical protein
MKVKYSNQFVALITGIFLAGMTHSYGQISDKPNNNNLSLDGKTLYEHGYNSTGQDTSREDRDSVMVTSVMNYFVMPDKNYNAGYYAQTGYAATNLTSSNFVWTVPGASGTFVPQIPNPTTGTSPWIKVTWIATGITTIKVKEEPQGLAGSCDSEETEISVVVIPKPTIGFNQTGTPPAYAASDCYSDADIATAAYDFPITVTTSSSQVLIDYSIKKTDLAGAVTTTPVTGAPVTSGTLRLTFSDYGEYEVTITRITDRIARKCDVEGDILTGADVFTYNVMPQPKTGPVFHIPNNF